MSLEIDQRIKDLLLSIRFIENKFLVLILILNN